MGAFQSWYLQLPMPSEFPAETFDDVMTLIETGGFTAAGREHARVGWYGVGYRYLSMATADEAFRDSLRRQGDALVNPTERAEQETALFLFFAAACSVVECFSYTAFASAAGIGNQNFKIEEEDQRRQIKPAVALKALRSSYPESSLVANFARVCSSSMWREMSVTRNVLVHQASPLRHLHLNSKREASQPPSIRQGLHAGSDLVVDPSLTADRRRWLSETLESLAASLETSLGEAARRSDRGRQAIG